MIRKAKRSGLYTEVSTNASLLTPELGAALLDAGLDEIAFSLDAANESDYERIRKGATYLEVIRNVEAFLALSAARRRRAPITVVRMVVMDESKIEEFSLRWANNVDSLQFNQLRVYDETGIGTKVKRGVRAVSPPTQLRRKVRCRQILHHLLVHWGGTVGLCNQSSVCVGNANKESLEAIWNGHVLRKIRGLHANYQGHRIDVCRVCPVMEPAVASAAYRLREGAVTRRAFWSDGSGGSTWRRTLEVKGSSL